MTTYVEPSYNTGILHPVRTASHQHKSYMGTLSKTHAQPTDAPLHRNGSTKFKKLMCKGNTTSKRLENITTLTPTNSQISMSDLVWLSSIHKQRSGRHMGPSLQSVHTASTTSKPKVAEFLFSTGILKRRAPLSISVSLNQPVLPAELPPQQSPEELQRSPEELPQQSPDEPRRSTCVKHPTRRLIENPAWK